MIRVVSASVVALALNGCDAKPKTPSEQYSTDLDVCHAALDLGWFDAPEVERKHRAIAWHDCIDAARDARDRRTAKGRQVAP